MNNETMQTDVMTTDEKLRAISAKIDSGKRLRILILGLGSVGNYLLNYLLSTSDEGIEIVVAGRNAQKMQSDVNIARVSALIRRENKTQVKVVGDVDLEDVNSIAHCLSKVQPDFIVNTSRVFAGLKYGSISWVNVRAYGIWTPLSIRYIRNIMEAYEKSGCRAIVINTSYSDGTIPWLKSAGKAYPDFGSGNLNHIVPRVKMAVAEIIGIDDFWNIDVDLATAHFHDVVISKEGQTEGVEQLIRVVYKGKTLEIGQDEIFSRCAISMPTDAKRNMMNASSNFDIIECILRALRGKCEEKFFSPGAFGEIGGYPVLVKGATCQARIDTSVFTLDEMRQKNRKSIYLDGIEKIEGGSLFYTDELLEKVKRAFGVDLPKQVKFDEIDSTAEKIIDEIILPALEKQKQ